MQLSYLFIHISLLIMLFSFGIKIIILIKKGNCQLNIFKIINNIIFLDGLKNKQFSMWLFALLMHLGILFLVATDTTLGINTLGTIMGFKFDSFFMVKLARTFCFIGGILSLIGLIGIMIRTFIFNNGFTLINLA